MNLSKDQQKLLRLLPGVDQLLEQSKNDQYFDNIPKAVVINSIRHSGPKPVRYPDHGAGQGSRCKGHDYQFETPDQCHRSGGAHQSRPIAVAG